MIKPCPFCDGVSIGDTIRWSDGTCYYRIVCQKCGNNSISFYTEQQAIDAWNNRPREEELLGTLKTFGDNYRLHGQYINSEIIFSIKQIIQKYEGENEA